MRVSLVALVAFVAASGADAFVVGPSPRHLLHSFPSQLAQHEPPVARRKRIPTPSASSPKDTATALAVAKDIYSSMKDIRPLDLNGDRIIFEGLENNGTPKAKSTAAANDLDNDVTFLRSQLHELRAEVAEANSRAAAAEQAMASAERVMAAAKKERETNSEASSEKVKRKEEAAKKLAKENKRLKKEVSDIQAASDAERTKLQLEVSSLRETLGETQESLSSAQQKQNMLEQNLAITNKVHAAHWQEVKAKMVEERLRMHETNNQSSSLKAALDEAKESQAKLEKSLDGANQRHAEEMSELRATMAAERTVWMKMTENPALQKALDDAQRISASSEQSLKNANQRQEEQIKQLKATLDGERAQWKKSLDGAMQKQTQLEKDLATAHQKHASELSVMKATMEAEREQWEKETKIYKLQSSLERAKQSQAMLGLCLDDANKKHDKHLIEIKETMEREQEKWDEAKSELSELQFSYDEAVQKQAELEQSLEDAASDSFELKTSMGAERVQFEERFEEKVRSVSKTFEEDVNAIFDQFENFSHGQGFMGG